MPEVAKNEETPNETAPKATKPKTSKPKNPKKLPKAAAKKGGEGRQETWKGPILKLLKKRPDGLTRGEIKKALNTKSLGGFLQNHPELVSVNTVEDKRGPVFKLTAAGRKAADAS